MAESLEARVQTFVRIRPHMQLLSITERKKNILQFNRREVFVDGVQTRDPQTYEFDGVFGPDATQEEVFNTVVKPIISDVMLGYSCTVLALGQTGSGKTYTLFGAKPQESISSWHDEDGAGLIIRAIDNLFQELPETDRKVSITYMELCNEQLFDLIAHNDDGNNIKIYEDSNKGTIRLIGATSAQVVNKEEVFKILERGALRRTSAGTHVEGELSRSHSIITIKVYVKESSMEEMNISDGFVKIGNLMLVDLADSSPISKACGVDKFMRQAATSNQSLLQLGRVITALTEKAQHIPYRASKLTRILQDSLGGQTKTRIISTVSPSASNLDETLNTLKYSAGARNIINRPVINTQTDIMNLIKALCEELKRLTLDLEATLEESGVFLTEEAYREIFEKRHRQSREYKEKLQIIASLKSEIKMEEAQMMELKNVFQKECAKLESIQTVIKNTEFSMRKLKYGLEKTKLELKEKHNLVNQMQSNEGRLSEQVKHLKLVCTDVTKDACSLYDKVDRIRYIEEENTEGVRKFKENMLNVFESIEKQFESIEEQKLQHLKNQKALIVNDYNAKHTVLQTMKDQTLQIFDGLKMKITGLEEEMQNKLNSSEEYVHLHSTEMMERGKNMIRNLHRNLQPVLEEILHTTVREFESLKINTTRKINEIEQQMDSLISDSSQFQQSLVALKISVLSKIDDLIKMLHQCSEEAEMTLSATISKRNHNKAQLMKLLEEVKKIQQISANNLVPDILKEQEKQFTNTVNLCTKVKCDADKLIKETAITQDAMNSNLTDCLNLNETVKEFHQRFKEVILASADQTTVTKIELNRFSELCNEKCKQYKDRAVEDTKEFSSVINDRIDSMKEVMEATPYELNTERKEQHLNSLTHKKDTLISEYDNNQNDVHLWQQQVAGEVKKLVNTTISECSNFKTYVPTGQTPERKEYKFPIDIIKSILPRTIIESEVSDNDRLLEEKKESF